MYTYPLINGFYFVSFGVWMVKIYWKRLFVFLLLCKKKRDTRSMYDSHRAGPFLPGRAKGAIAAFCRPRFWKLRSLPRVRTCFLLVNKSLRWKRPSNWLLQPRPCETLKRRWHRYLWIRMESRKKGDGMAQKKPSTRNYY